MVFQTMDGATTILLLAVGGLLQRSGGIHVALRLGMLKLLGSYALAKLLGFGLVGAIVIYALLSLVTR